MILRCVLIVLFFLSSSAYSGEVKDFKAKIFGRSEVFKLKDYLGKKKIIINFFATWCSPCVEEIPILNKLKENYKNHIYIAINAAEKKKELKKFLKKYKFNFIILEDPNSDIAEMFKINAIPVTIVISKEGKIIYKDKTPPDKL